MPISQRQGSMAMTSHYRKVGEGLWEGELAAFCRDEPERWIVVNYVLTCRHNKWGLGLYLLPLVYISEATGLALETCRRRVADVSETRFLRYDEATRTVFVRECARHEWGEAPNIKRNDVRSLARDLPDYLWGLRKSPLIDDFIERYGDGWAEIVEPFLTRLEGVADASATRRRRGERSVLPDPDPDPDPEPDACARAFIDQELAVAALGLIENGRVALWSPQDYAIAQRWVKWYAKAGGWEALKSDLEEIGPSAAGKNRPASYVDSILARHRDRGELGKLAEMAKAERAAADAQRRQKPTPAAQKLPTLRELEARGAL